MNARKIPTLLAFLFVCITLARVSHFADVHMQAGLLGWLFALCMGASVFFVSMQTKEHITIKEGAKEDRRSSNARTVAWAVLIPVILAEGLFNLADVLSALQPDTPLHIEIAAWVYGLFPTLIASGLGMLQGYLDRLPTPPQKAVHPLQNLTALLYARFMQQLENPAPVSVAFVPETPMQRPMHETQENTSIRHANAPTSVILPSGSLLATCRKCGWESNKAYATEKAKSNALAAHTRGCKGKRKAAAQLHKPAAVNGSGSKGE